MRPNLPRPSVPPTSKSRAVSEGCGSELVDNIEDAMVSLRSSSPAEEEALESVDSSMTDCCFAVEFSSSRSSAVLLLVASLVTFDWLFGRRALSFAFVFCICPQVRKKDRANVSDDLPTVSRLQEQSWDLWPSRSLEHLQLPWVC
jgi:hypothetical protein